MEREDIKNKKNEEEQLQNQEGAEQEADVKNEKEAEEVKAQEEVAPEEQKEDKSATLAKDLAEMKDKYLRLYSDFENFRRRTAKEKLDFMKTANEDLIVSLLAVVDDFERAQKHASGDEENEALNSFKQGVDLIQNKLVSLLENKGLKSMENPTGKEFDMDKHEAITQIPAPSEDLKGKVVDTVEKGYLLNDKVIRYAKVVVGS
ncbi:nucleotide exchange factor GrpE [Limibacter armeniacum]|uniref:nucleotide exchange factor GrpE n=1 Tax=Limibacter armeniacum TaxID=466084 RepID=UPI002FE56357